MTEKLIPRYSDSSDCPPQAIAGVGNLHRNPGQYEEIGTHVGGLVDKKNKAYGDSFHQTGNILRIYYPRGIRPDQYDDMAAIVRISDKMFRVATEKNAFGENPFEDIAGYGILKCRDDKEGYRVEGQGSKP